MVPHYHIQLSFYKSTKIKLMLMFNIYLKDDKNEDKSKH